MGTGMGFNFHSINSLYNPEKTKTQYQNILILCFKLQKRPRRRRKIFWNFGTKRSLPFVSLGIDRQSRLKVIFKTQIKHSVNDP